MDDEKYQRLGRRIRRLELSVGERLTDETPEHKTYIARVGARSIFFDTTDAYVRQWFFPRYSGGRLHEPGATQWLTEHLRANHVFVDVGAHIGYFSNVAASICRQVFAIEPQEFMIRRIRANSVINHFDNVAVLHAAVGERPGFGRVPQLGNPRTRVNKVGAGGSLVPMITLDDYFADEYFPNIIKVDVEGFESYVLKGAEKILEKGTTLLIEVHPRALSQNGSSADYVIETIRTFGYSVYGFRHREKFDELVEVNVSEKLYNNQMIVCMRDSGG